MSDGLWPLCLTCGQEYIPIAALRGCPWCSGATTPRSRPHQQKEHRTCPSCGGPRRRHATQCWDCYILSLKRRRKHNPTPA